MVRLEKFYDLIGRNTLVTLTNAELDRSYYDGSVRDIPAEYADCEVEDFCVSDKGDVLFIIKLKEPRRVYGGVDYGRCRT